MSEQLAKRSELDTQVIGNRSLREWHTWLNTDPRTGDSTVHFDCPGSRYGRKSGDCAWWAIATELAYVSANGLDDDPEVSIDWLMGLAVNDADDIQEIVADYWDQLPAEVQDLLGGEQPGVA